MTTTSIILFTLAAVLMFGNLVQITLLHAQLKAGKGGNVSLIPAYLAIVLAVVGYCLR